MSSSSFNNIYTFFNKIIELRRRTCSVPFSKTTLKFIYLLYQENYLESFFYRNDKIFVTFRVFDGTFSFKKLSCPVKKGQSSYIKLSSVWKSSSGNFGQVFLSTSKGLIAEYTVKKSQKGGRIICFVI